MNTKGKSTLEKFKNVLKLKNYADNTILIYTHYISEFILSFDKSALHITIHDMKNSKITEIYTHVSTNILSKIQLPI